MRWLFGIIFFACLGIFTGYVLIKGYPYRLYSDWIQGQGWNKYYTLKNYKPLYLAPVAIQKIPPYKEDYAQLWKVFPLQNVQIPLPVRHPLFQTIPLIKHVGKRRDPQIGITLLNPLGREISRVYTLPLSLVQDHSQGQDLFKLPYVRNRIKKYPLDKLWKDIFSHKIEVRSKPLSEMIYDLYILHLRSKILPAQTLKYGLLRENKAMVELSSKDKDYSVELIMTFSSGSIYSFVIRTEKNSDESLKLRSKFLENVSFNPADPAMGRILYKEFKQLNFARQVDQEGMLYLYSAWSQDPLSSELMKEMIFFLERGRNNRLQLSPLYEFAYKQFGKTFSTKKIFSDHDDPNLALTRKIEIEEIERAAATNKAKGPGQAPLELTPDEKMNLYLRRAKETAPSEKKDMTIH